MAKCLVCLGRMVRANPPTVKMLLGLLYPTKGHIEVFGNSPRHVQTKARIGYLPEESYLYRYLNSRETLDFFGNLFHLDKADRDKRAEQLLEMVGLNQTRTRSVGEFSKACSAASVWRRRSSTILISSFSMNPRRVSIRLVAARSGFDHRPRQARQDGDPSAVFAFRRGGCL